MKDKLAIIKDALVRHKTLVANFGYLSILQAFSIILPLITIPYLMRTLGIDKYGLVIYAQAIIQYFVIIVNFGFNISATRDVSVHRDDKAKVSEIVSSVITVKVLLFIVSFLALLITIFSIPVLREHYMLYLFCMGLCLSEVLFPVWYFQGIEKMRYITIINVISRSLFAACIFIFIKRPEHFVLVPVFNGFGALVGGSIALWIVFKKERVVFAFQKWTTMWHYIKDSAPLFLTRASAQIYVRTNIVVVGSVLGMTEAAYYEVALKVVTAASLPFHTLKTAIFPKVSKELNLAFVHKTIKVVIVVAILGIVGLQFTSGFIIEKLSGTASVEGSNVLRILSLTILAIVMSGFFGEQLLIPFSRKRAYVRGMVSTALFYFALLSTLYVFNLLNLYSIVLVVVGTEFFLALYFLFSCRKYKLL